MLILALDLGLTTGWSLLDTAARIDRQSSGVWQLDDYGPEAHARFVALADRLDAAIAAFYVGDARRPAMIAYESVRFAGGGPDAGFSYGGLRAVMLLKAATYRVPYIGVTPAQVKRAAGLRSHAPKEQVLEAAGRRWPAVRFATHDEADARFVALAAAIRPAVLTAAPVVANLPPATCTGPMRTTHPDQLPPRVSAEVAPPGAPCGVATTARRGGYRGGC